MPALYYTLLFSSLCPSVARKLSMTKTCEEAENTFWHKVNIKPCYIKYMESFRMKVRSNYSQLLDKFPSQHTLVCLCPLQYDSRAQKTGDSSDPWCLSKPRILGLWFLQLKWGRPNKVQIKLVLKTESTIDVQRNSRFNNKICPLSMSSTTSIWFSDLTLQVSLWFLTKIRAGGSEYTLYQTLTQNT